MTLIPPDVPALICREGAEHLEAEYANKVSRTFSFCGYLPDKWRVHIAVYVLRNRCGGSEPLTLKEQVVMIHTKSSVLY